MNRQEQLVFYLADFEQYTYILENEVTQKKIASFLLKYVSIEAFYKKMLITEKERNGKKLTVREKKNLNVTAADVKRVSDYFGVSIDEGLVERVFGSNDKSYMECSAKKLRDRLVHSVNSNALRCIVERYDNLNRDLDAFLDYFSAHSEQITTTSVIQ